MILMRKAMTQAISMITILIIGLVMMAIIIIMVGDKFGKGSDAANDTIGVSIDSLDCPIECSRCCSSGYGDDICSRNYKACDCTCN